MLHLAMPFKKRQISYCNCNVYEKSRKHRKEKSERNKDQNDLRN